MMLLLNPDDPLELTWIKIQLADIIHYLDTHDGHRAEIDRAVADCFRRWSELNNKEVA